MALKIKVNRNKIQYPDKVWIPMRDFTQYAMTPKGPPPQGIDEIEGS